MWCRSVECPAVEVVTVDCHLMLWLAIDDVVGLAAVLRHLLRLRDLSAGLETWATEVGGRSGFGNSARRTNRLYRI